MKHRKFPSFAVLVLIVGILPGACVGPIVAGGAATAGYIGSQEREFGDAMEDGEIQLDIQTAMLESDRELFLRVGIEVVEGRVLLTGNVPLPENRIEAARIAWQTRNVREVANEIQVTDRSSIGNFLRDTAITSRLRPKLIFDEDIASVNYSIDTVNAVVYIIGIARSQEELDRVHYHAQNTSGVREVVSYIEVRQPQPDNEESASN